MNVPSASVFITGVSSGIGHGLADSYLSQGWQVYGVSRRPPKKLIGHTGFHFRSLDLADESEIGKSVRELVSDLNSLDLVVLNAGILGRFGDLAEASLDQVREVMNVNVWANKLLIDALYEDDRSIKQVVVISSGASVNGNRGWGAYSISKAAVNMLTKLYAEEHSDTHFTAFAPGLVDTAMQDEICGFPESDKFPSLGVIRSKRHTAEMPRPEMISDRFVDVFRRLPDLVPSGAYADIRQPPLSELSST